MAKASRKLWGRAQVPVGWEPLLPLLSPWLSPLPAPSLQAERCHARRLISSCCSCSSASQNYDIRGKGKRKAYSTWLIQMHFHVQYAHHDLTYVCFQKVNVSCIFVMSADGRPMSTHNHIQYTRYVVSVCQPIEYMSTVSYCIAEITHTLLTAMIQCRTCRNS